MKNISLELQVTASPALQIMRVGSPHLEFVHLRCRCGHVEQSDLFALTDSFLPLFFEEKEACLKRGQHLMLRRGWYDNKNGHCLFGVELIYGKDSLPAFYSQKDADRLAQKASNFVEENLGLGSETIGVDFTSTKANFQSDYFTLFDETSYPKV